MLGFVFPHAEYAEDQQYSATILYSHVLYRGIQMGGFFGSGIGLVRAGLQYRKAVPAAQVGTAFLRSAGVGGAIGLGLLSVALPLKMRNAQKIEFQDRSWRLLANKHQEQVDDWSLVGSVVGVAGVTATAARPIGWRTLMGGLAGGSLAGVGALLLWTQIAPTKTESKMSVSEVVAKA